MTKSVGKQEVDEWGNWKGETQYNSSCKSNIPNILTFPPIEAEKPVTKRIRDGQGDCNIATNKSKNTHSFI